MRCSTVTGRGTVTVPALLRGPTSFKTSLASAPVAVKLPVGSPRRGCRCGCDGRHHRLRRHRPCGRAAAGSLDGLAGLDSPRRQDGTMAMTSAIAALIVPAQQREDIR